MRVLRAALGALVTYALILGLGYGLLAMSPIKPIAEPPTFVSVLSGSVLAAGRNTGVLVALARTAALIALSTVAVVCLSVPIGIVLGLHAGDSRAFLLINMISGVPSVVTAFVLLKLFAVVLPIFPVFGFVSVHVVGGPLPIVTLDVLHHLVLPALVLAVADGSASEVVEIVAARVRRVKTDGFVELAQALALPNRLLYGKYLLATCLTAVVVAVRARVAMVVATAVVVERIFGIHGAGHRLLEAVENSDFAAAAQFLVAIAGLTAVLQFTGRVAILAIERPGARPHGTRPHGTTDGQTDG